MIQTIRNMLIDFKAKSLAAKTSQFQAARISASWGGGAVTGYILATLDHSGYAGALVFVLGAFMLIVGLKGMHDAERHK